MKTNIYIQATLLIIYIISIQQHALAQFDYFSVGVETSLTGNAVGYDTKALGEYSTATGHTTKALGDYSTAMGFQSNASGKYSTAVGASTNAIGDFSLSMGYSSYAQGHISAAMGFVCSADGEASFALGFGANTNANYSAAIGMHAKTEGEAAISLGRNTSAKGDYSLSTGRETEASGYVSSALGYKSIASGDYSIAIGDNSLANAYSAIALGSYNIGSGNANSWVETDPILEVGIGTTENDRKNALTILKNGNVGIADDTPEYELDVKGTIATNYLYPTFKSDQYKFIRFGEPNDYWGGFMYNINNAYYGPGNNLSIFTYLSRDIKLQAGLGNILLGASSVGIGTDSPVGLLDVKVGESNFRVAGSEQFSTPNGAISFCDHTDQVYRHALWLINTPANGGMFGGITNAPTFESAPDGGVYILPASQNNWNDWEASFAVKPDGKVGIGTNEPTAKLAVISNTTDDEDNTARFEAPLIGNRVSHIHYGETGDWYIRSANKVGNVVIQDGEDGNVGIGVSAPEAKLHVKGQIKLESLQGEGDHLVVDNNGFLSRTDIVEGVWSQNGNNIFYNDGNVGIGTPTPSAKLEIKGNNIIQIDEGDPNIYVNIGKQGTFHGITTQNKVDEKYPFLRTGVWESDDDKEGPTIEWGGGQSTLKFVHKLTNDNLPNDYVMRLNHPNNTIVMSVNGKVYASNGYSQGSDKRFKKNIKEITHALEIVNRLNPVSYEFKKEEFPQKHFSDGETFGFVAQELEKVIPQVVNKGEDDFYNVDYIAIIPLLTQAIQEQQATIEVLKNEINTMKNAKNTNFSLENSKINTEDEKAVLGNKLYQNAPNPFSESTTIHYELEEAVQQAFIFIYDLRGKQLEKVELSKDKDHVIIQGGSLAAGMYQYALIADGKLIDSKSMILTK